MRALNTLAEDNVDLNFRQFFLACLSDPDDQVRAIAVDGLWEDESSRTLEALLQLVEDPSGMVRVAAVLGLSRFAYMAEMDELSEEDALAVCTTLLDVASDDKQPMDVLRRAVEALGYFANSPEAQAEIGRAYQSGDQLMRESSMVAMGRSIRAEWVPYIERELRSPSPAMRYEAARAVGEMADEGRPLLQKLLPLVEDDDIEIAVAAIWALGQVGGPQARQVLSRIVRTNDDARRRAADDALADLNLEAF
ncbi:MAG: HEAT repeat domain-containing protein [Chloroflexaceae bacterium]|nr:HEAT repeat domain-containing protein [Chloroflexaceae bacterium]